MHQFTWFTPNKVINSLAENVKTKEKGFHLLQKLNSKEEIFTIAFLHKTFPEPSLVEEMEGQF